MLGGLATWVLTSPGWPEVRELFFNWGVFKESFPEVLEGFWLDVKLFVIVEIVVLAVGLGIALIRSSLGAALFPLIVPAHVLGRGGGVAPSNRITLGGIGIVRISSMRLMD